jgi:mannose-6-phosphate isomerase class I
MNAVKHYQKTGKHKQVSIRYNPVSRTQFKFNSWKHERDSESVRKILPEDILISSEGYFYVVGKDNRYNLKQYASQFAQHPRSYRLDRLVVE